MAVKRFIVDAPREPTIHDVVDRIMANIEAESAYKVPNVVDAPEAAPAAQPPAGAGPARWSGSWPEGGIAPGKFDATEPDYRGGMVDWTLRAENWLGANWSGGRVLRPGEPLGPNDYTVAPRSSADRGAYWHDISYELMRQNLDHALNSGASNSAALADYHRAGIAADRALAADLANAQANTPYGKALLWGAASPLSPISRAKPNSWADNRQTILNRLQSDGHYKSYVDQLPREQLLGLLMPLNVGAEDYRVRQQDHQRRLMNLVPNQLYVP